MILSVSNLSKEFKDLKAVNGINLEITPGIWGLLGANGAGKTTFMRMLAGIMKPTTGEIKYDGISINELGAKYRNIFGYLPQDFGFYPEFSVKDYLEYMAVLKDIPSEKVRAKINDLLDILSLAEVKNKKIIKLSGGMKRRVGIAQALLNDPEILVLDEPTSGLDPGERVRFRNLLTEFANERIIIVSTHIVSDIEYISTQNAIMKDGKIEIQGTTEQLLEKVKDTVWSCSILPHKLKEYENRLRIVSLKNEQSGNILIRYLSDQSEISGSISSDPRLEDLYLWLFPQVYGEQEVKI